MGVLLSPLCMHKQFNKVSNLLKLAPFSNSAGLTVLLYLTGSAVQGI